MAITLQQYAAEIQDPLRQGLVDMLWQSSRIMPLLNFIKWDGISYPYTKRTGRPGVGTRNLNGSFTIAPGRYAPDIETLTILGGKVQTDTMMLQLKPQLRETEIAGTMEAGGLMFDRLFFQGNPALSGHSSEFYGIAARAISTQTIAAATNGATVTATMANTLLDMVVGPNSQKALMMSRTNRRILSADLLSLAGGARMIEVGEQLGADGVQGVAVTTYQGAKIITVEKDENDAEILPFTESQGSSNAASSIYCVRLGGAIDERDVQGIISSELKVSPPANLGEYILDVIQMFAGIGIFGGYSVARLSGCTAS